MRVKCPPDRELLAGRREFPAVHISHPAASEDSSVYYLLLWSENLQRRYFLCKKARTTSFPGFLNHPVNSRRSPLSLPVPMFGALSVVLGYYSFKITPNLKIGFGSIPNMLVDYLFGPVVGGLFGGAMDVIKFMLKPDGGFMPGLRSTRCLRRYLRPVLL